MAGSFSNIGIGSVSTLFGGIPASAGINNGSNNSSSGKNTNVTQENLGNGSATKPPVVDSEFDDSSTTQMNKGVSAYDLDKSNARTDTKGVYDDMRAADPNDLNRYQSSRYDRDGGQYGRGNNLGYNRTLKLSREADAYNNKPSRAVFLAHGNGTNGSNGFDVSLYKPERIETEEMREMQKSRQLDQNQKQLAQALQDAVNHKDYDAFKQYMTQLYGYELSDYQLKSAMHTFGFQQRISNEVFRSQQDFAYLCKLWGIEMYAQELYRIGEENPLKAMYISAMLTGGPVGSIEDYAANDTFISLLAQYRRIYGDNMSPAAWAQFMNQYKTMTNNMATDASLVTTQSLKDAQARGKGK